MWQGCQLQGVECLSRTDVTDSDDGRKPTEGVAVWMNWVWLLVMQWKSVNLPLVPAAPCCYGDCTAEQGRKG